MAKKTYGNVKRGYWNGVWYDSSWELALMVYCHDHGIELTRNSKKFPYKWYNHIEYYQPDFISSNGTYLEVKGINDYKAKKKVASFPYPIKVLTYKDMKKYLDYMSLTYGAGWREKF